MDGKTVLITGAGSGLGKALVEVFSSNEWEAIGVTRNNVNLSNQKSLETYVAKLNSKAIDVLINCAGVYDSPEDDETVVATIPQISKVFQVNTIGARVLTDLLLPHLQKGQEKLVVTISSGMGTYAEMDKYHAQHWPYSASKTAVNYAMIAFNEVHPNIKCVLINPGWMKTKIGGSSAPLDPKFSAQKIFELIKDHKNRLPNRELVDYEGNIMDFRSKKPITSSRSFH